jgi:lipopolysaccharide transport system permease protein
VSAPTIVIRPTRGIPSLGIAELFQHRELVYFFAWRDVKVKYRQAALGVAWTLLQPLASVAIFSLVFSRVASAAEPGPSYPLRVFAGLLPWQLLTTALAHSSQSLVVNKNVLTKVYFPRLALPVATVVAALVDVVLAFAAFVVLALASGVAPTRALLLLPAFGLVALALALGVATWVSALNARYRDVQFAIPFLVQLWTFATPIVYPISFLPEAWRPLIALNPAAGVVEGFRLALLGASPMGPGALVGSAAISLLVLGSGVAYFRASEKTLADEL